MPELKCFVLLNLIILDTNGYFKQVFTKWNQTMPYFGDRISLYILLSIQIFNKKCVPPPRTQTMYCIHKKKTCQRFKQEQKTFCVVLFSSTHDQTVKHYSDTEEQQPSAPGSTYSAVHISTVRPQRPISAQQLPLWLLTGAWMDKLGTNPNKPKVATAKTYNIM